MADVYFDDRMETLPLDLLRRLQDHRLRWQFRRCWDGSPFYRARLEAAGLTPETFGGLADLTRLPLLSGEDLSGVDPSAWQVAPDEWIPFEHESDRRLDGTEHTRRVTHGDMTHSADRYARARWAIRVWEPLWAGVTRRAGPPGAKSVGSRPLDMLDIGFAGDQVAYLCRSDDGYHWVGDQLLAELVVTGERQRRDNRQTGELVVTDLVREASPLIRYRTGLTLTASETPCACGRTGLRLWPSSSELPLLRR